MRLFFSVSNIIFFTLLNYLFVILVLLSINVSIETDNIRASILCLYWFSDCLVKLLMWLLNSFTKTGIKCVFLRIKKHNINVGLSVLCKAVSLVNEWQLSQVH